MYRKLSLYWNPRETEKVGDIEFYSHGNYVFQLSSRLLEIRDVDVRHNNNLLNSGSQTMVCVPLVVCERSQDGRMESN